MVTGQGLAYELPVRRINPASLYFTTALASTAKRGRTLQTPDKTVTSHIKDEPDDAGEAFRPPLNMSAFPREECEDASRGASLPAIRVHRVLGVDARASAKSTSSRVSGICAHADMMNG